MREVSVSFEFRVDIQLEDWCSRLSRHSLPIRHRLRHLARLQAAQRVRGGAQRRARANDASVSLGFVASMVCSRFVQTYVTRQCPIAGNLNDISWDQYLRGDLLHCAVSQDFNLSDILRNRFNLTLVRDREVNIHGRTCEDDDRLQE